MNAAGHLSPVEAAAFARGGNALSPAERLAVSDHAAACAACRSLLVGARAAAGPPPGLARVFAGLVEAGRQEENPPPEPWSGAAEFTAALPALTPVEHEELRVFQTRLDQFAGARFVPGGTLGPARETTRREIPAARGAVSEAGDWWQRLFSWPGLTLAGVMAAILLALVVGLPRARQAASGPTAAAAPADLVDGPVQVAADGTFVGLASLPSDLRAAVAETIRRGAAPGALLGKRTRGGGAGAVPSPAAAANDPAAAIPLSPVGTSVETDQPVFRWKTPPAPAAVEVVVRPSAGGGEIRSVPLPADAAAWTPPTPLPRGALYRWQLEAVSSDGARIIGSTDTKLGAVFKVLSADAHARLEALRAGPSGQSHLTLGVAYSREGLREEAAREFRALRASNARSVLAKRLVDSLEGRGG